MLLFVWTRHSAENLADLSLHRVTHVLNAAQCGRHTGAGLYNGTTITYMGIEARDSCDFDLSLHFQRAACFIDGALARGGGYANAADYVLTSSVKSSVQCLCKYRVMDPPPSLVCRRESPGALPRGGEPLSHPGPGLPHAEAEADPGGGHLRC